MSRRISDIENDFERAICQAIYKSRDQRARRYLVTALLWLKHILRGLLFSWPLYLLALAALFMDEPQALWLLLLLIPAVWVSGRILRRGIREDHRRLIKDMIFGQGYLKHVLWPKDE